MNTIEEAQIEQDAKFNQTKKSMLYGLAAANGHDAAFNYLSTPDEQSYALLWAARNKSPAVLEHILSKAPQLTTRHKISALAWAAQYGNVDAISFLLEITPELTSNAKASALIVAADNGQVEAVRLLWQKTPDIALPFLKKAQSVANAKNHLDVVALLSNPSSFENRIDIESNSIQKR